MIDFSKLQVLIGRHPNALLTVARFVALPIKGVIIGIVRAKRRHLDTPPLTRLLLGLGGTNSSGQGTNGAQTQINP